MATPTTEEPVLNTSAPAVSDSESSGIGDGSSRDALLAGPGSSSKFSSRFGLWYTLTVFSAVSLIALSTRTITQQWRAGEKWVLIVTLLSLLLSSLASLAHVGLRDTFDGMPIEGLFLFTELGFWVGGLIVMMDTNLLMALDENGGILNANLYFFSWASLATTVALLVDYHLQQNLPSTASSDHIPNEGYWAGIAVASLVAMISSLQVFVNDITVQEESFQCQGDDAESGFCQRLKFSIALGAVSCFFSAACGLLCSKMSCLVSAITSFMALFAWVLGVAFVTFGDESPGTNVGNLYFSCWASFVLSLCMVSSCIKFFMALREEAKKADYLLDSNVEASDAIPEADMAQELQCKPDDEEAETTTFSEEPITPNSISAVKNGQPSHQVPSEADDETDPAAPLSTVEFPSSSQV